MILGFSSFVFRPTKPNNTQEMRHRKNKPDYRSNSAFQQRHVLWRGTLHFTGTTPCGIRGRYLHWRQILPAHVQKSRAAADRPRSGGHHRRAGCVVLERIYAMAHRSVIVSLRHSYNPHLYKTDQRCAVRPRKRSRIRTNQNTIRTVGTKTLVAHNSQRRSFLILLSGSTRPLTQAV